jgi:hypothetical protein
MPEEGRRLTWGVSVCVEGEAGHRPLPDYSGYDDEKRARGIALRLNERIGISPAAAQEIVRSTLLASMRAEREAKATRKRRPAGSA